MGYVHALKVGQSGYAHIDCLLSAAKDGDTTKAVPKLVSGTCFYEESNPSRLKVTNEKGIYVVELPPGKPWFITPVGLFTSVMSVEVVLIDQKGRRHTEIPDRY